MIRAIQSLWQQIARRPTRRMALWLALLLLVAGLLVTLIWLAGRYEADQNQARVDRDAQDAASDIRAGLTRNVQSLQALRTSLPQWKLDAEDLLRSRRELARLEWRDTNFKLLASAQSPYIAAPQLPLNPRDIPYGDLQLACERARRQSGPMYAPSHFSPLSAGQGSELMELCLPLIQAGQHQGYLVAVYGLQAVLVEIVGKPLQRGQELSFTEPDGTRLAIQGVARRGGRMFTSQQLLDLPGNTVVLRADSWRITPDLFPNVLTAVVTVMSIALVGVLLLLGRDINRRLRAERELADALAFRKAMEDSLVTGLRARDMEGHIRYVNPAFCAMTGFDADELMGKKAPMPYWPPELIDEYQQRQAVRLSGNAPAREGYESVFIRKDGSRFSVLVFEAPLIDAQGTQSGWMSAILDISEQRRMEELSRASQERLQASARLATMGEMASLLSHELNQPLAAISSYAAGTANMMQEPSIASPQDVSHALTQIANQAERAGKVIKSVHDFVRRRESKHERVSAQSLLDAVMPLVQLQARKLSVQVQMGQLTGLPAVMVDRVMVEQVLLNLARNGIQAMEATAPAQRILHIRARTLGTQWLEFLVADFGQGITNEIAKQLFTPFFSTKAEGMGLGLSLCRTVVEQHGGFLQFEANQPNGAVFVFSLPVASTNMPSNLDVAQ
ncbi:PAS domain S-box protein [Variovorax sp. PCZ-1]|uniref:sensor histidine kinase n=1 Tax=Variovorax sp. PCZ-1 TaxID=2835533 RepID=UPI001BCC485B|nr:PAS domain S-box protein [Variovorax sp. PCZ-1]MBS7808898.1 PAS domain S-box protein [Variovorax sp. PCZ-1]